jgi:protein-L-isoaspartate(D-aspartate) O-methyltransferase
MNRDILDARREMVQHQLQMRGITDLRVLAAMSAVPREEFVPAERRDQAYADRALPLKHGQTISQPFTVAMMCETASPQPHERVLDVGTGSGYAAAVLSRLANEVHSVECVPELAKSAADRLQALGYDNVSVHEGDGSRGLPEHGPYDVIVVAAAAPELPDPYAHQLNENGRIVLPVGNEVRGQKMMKFTKRGDRLIAENLGAFSFVPLVGQHGIG